MISGLSDSVFGVMNYENTVDGGCSGDGSADGWSEGYG